MALHTIAGAALIALGPIVAAIGIYRSKTKFYPNDRWFR